MRFAALITLAAAATATATAVDSGSSSSYVPRRSLYHRQNSPPEGKTGCVQHGDHWHCDDEATATEPAEHDDHDHTATNATTVDEHDHAAEASSTAAVETDEQKLARGCTKHIDHWHCPDEESHGSSSSETSNSENGKCIIHIGHTHGDCSQQQLCSGTLGSYDMPLHIGSVFIVLVTSAVGVAIPFIAKWMRAETRADREGAIFFIARHFGTGIIISTAFIHLLFHGFTMFASQCLDGALVYEATAPALAMAAAFITFLFDLAGARGTGGGGHGSADHVHGVVGGGGEAAMPSETNSTASADGGEKGIAADLGHSHSHSHSHDHDHDHDHPAPANIPMCTHSSNHLSQDGWQVVMLEAGIIFHSIMIGVTLGAGSGAGWTTLLIVIVFHQFFEGAALATRIALLCISRLRAAIMALAFIIITPIGIGIGIGVRHALAEHPKNAMIAVGVLNSLSAGILLYTAFKLLSVDFVDGPLRRASVRRIVAAVAAMMVGMAAMSVLGKWA